jgi:hypothetical protein
MLWRARSARLVGVEWALLVGALFAGDGNPWGVRCDPIDKELDVALKLSSLAAAYINSLVFFHSAVFPPEAVLAA